MRTNKELLLFQMITVSPTAWSSSPRSNFSWTISLQSPKTWVIIYQLTKCHILRDGNLQNLQSTYRQKKTHFQKKQVSNTVREQQMKYTHIVFNILSLHQIILKLRLLFFTGNSTITNVTQDKEKVK
jgi:hypothetical protein